MALYQIKDGMVLINSRHAQVGEVVDLDPEKDAALIADGIANGNLAAYEDAPPPAPSTNEESNVDLKAELPATPTPSGEIAEAEPEKPSRSHSKSKS